MHSFYWYDLETFGRDPRRTRIAQFAGQRTAPDLEPIGEPLVRYCQPADDLLPSPDASLITGLSPQRCRREGLVEREFVADILGELEQPGTCAAGFNSLRFDEEFLRHALYRNFRDPYAREWRDGNSRWDLLELARLQYALRPDGVDWPRREDGEASFRLEHLAAANGVAHGQAHDALSDVEATLGVARALRRAQPKLFDYYLGLRDKRRVASLLDYAGMTPVLHVSGRFPASRRCAAVVLPIAPDPEVGNRIIVLDLGQDPAELVDADAEAIAERLFVPAADLPEGAERFRLKTVQLNRCPALVALAHLRDEDFALLDIDRAEVEARAAAVRAAADLPERVRRAFALTRGERAPSDADAALYDGFPDERDRRRFPELLAAAPGRLRSFAGSFADPRYEELLFRFRARNHPDSLDPAERRRWDDYRRRRFAPGSELGELSMPDYFARIQALRIERPAGPDQALLDELESWGRDLAADLDLATD